MEKIDTIVALATPAGFGGVAVVRISGPLVLQFMQPLLGKTITERKAIYCNFLDENGLVIDAGIAIYYRNPNSFTGEDVLELQGHSGPVVVDLLIKRILSLGARLANPGEFSLRAFINNKIDLAQAEAIADLIHASSETAARAAIRSLQGEFSKAINTLNEKLVTLRMYIEAAIDFAAEEIDFLQDEVIGERLQHLFAAINGIEAQAKQGSLLREGATVVIAGMPNVGKSSLLNALSGKDLAIVTPVPGTTRDVRREQIQLDGIPITLIDTAGLRESDDVVEQEGIRRAHQEIQQADIVINVMSCEDQSVMQALVGIQIPNINCRQINVYNKVDLLAKEAYIEKNWMQAHPGMTGRDASLSKHENENGIPNIYLSAKLNLGLDLLVQEIKTSLGYQKTDGANFYARRRHLAALAKAKSYIQNSLQQWQSSRFGELIAEDLRLAHLALCDITGEFSADDLLGKIFSNFCIGK